MAREAILRGEEEPPAVELRRWHDDRYTGFVILRLVVETVKVCRVECTLKVADNEHKNVIFPICSVTENMANKRQQYYVHNLYVFHT